MKVAGRLVVVGVGLLLAACGSAGSGASPTTAVTSSIVASPVIPASPTTPAPSDKGTAEATPNVAGSNLPSSCLPPPHEAPEIEAALPKTIAGRMLAIESYDGALMVTCLNGGTATDVSDFAAAMAAEGLSLDDVSVAVAGRSDTNADPPYFIFAYQLTGHSGAEWPATTGVDYPAAADFQEADIEGKHVLVGDVAGVDQSEHSRGRPIVWNSPKIHYLIVTDDEAWAREALRALR